MSVTINVDIDGTSHPISACSWYFIAPCGCTHGVMTTRDYDNDGWITTPTHAMAEMTPNKAVREQDIAAGERCEIGLNGVIGERLTGNCPHTPKWGRPAIPEGMEWGGTRSGRVVHIVEALDRSESENILRHPRIPLCGSFEDLFEIGRHTTSDAPMCKKCIKIGATA